MKLNHSLIAVAIIFPHVSIADVVRTFTVSNKCSYTIWPGMFTDLNVGSAVPKYTTGWEAAPNTQVSFAVPDNWTAGRIWGRRECDFSSNAKRDSNTTDEVFSNVDKLDPVNYVNLNARIVGPDNCKSGGCNGGLECDPHTGGGVPPATLGEWTLSASGGLDYYDVSVVDGFNIPMQITNSKGCRAAGCLVDLNPQCPTVLKGPVGSTGTTLGCMSSCKANLDGHDTDSGNCCSGSHNTPATCPQTGVAYYSYFKDSCPDAYAYAYDEASGKALYTCASNLKADYTVTFCP